MRNYKNRYSGKGRSLSQKIGFYSALSICIIAVGLAVWSTYTSVNEYMKSGDGTTAESQLSDIADVGNELTGVTEPVTTVPVPTNTQSGAVIVISETRPEPTQEPQTTKIYEEPLTQSVLQMIMAVSEDLGYPLADKTVIQEYSEEAVLNETMGDYRAHTGTDFKGAAGDAISAMSDGTVNGIYTDDYLGNVVSVQCDNYEIHYCGLDEVNVSKGDTVEQGDELGTLGEIPSEEALGSHLHIEIKVNGQYCDPLALITGEE